MKGKRMIALAGVILIIALFITAIFLAITGAPKESLMAVLFSIVYLSILFYTIGLISRVLRKSQFPSKEPEKKDSHPQNPDH